MHHVNKLDLNVFLQFIFFNLMHDYSSKMYKVKNIKKCIKSIKNSMLIKKYEWKNYYLLKYYY